MIETRKSWGPQSGKGSQNNNTEIYKILANTMLDICRKQDKKEIFQVNMKIIITKYKPSNKLNLIEFLREEMGNLNFIDTVKLVNNLSKTPIRLRELDAITFSRLKFKLLNIAEFEIQEEYIDELKSINHYLALEWFDKLSDQEKEYISILNEHHVDLSSILGIVG